MVMGAILGMIWFVRRFGASPVFLGMLTHIVLTLCVFAGYSTWDRFAFLLAAFTGLNFFAGLGLGSIPALLGQRRGTALVCIWTCLSLIAGPTLYGSAVAWAHDPLSVWHGRYGDGHSGHLYNQAEYIVNPNKRSYRDVETFAELLFEKLPPDSLFLDDDSRSYYPLAEYFQRHYGKRKDISFLLVNSWGFSDWGLSSDNLASLVERAYYLDKPFFAASTGAPYSAFFSSIRRKIPIQFEPFPLAENRWVYRLVTAHTGSRQAALNALLEKGMFKPVVIRGARGEVDLTESNVSFSASAGLQEQSMDSFGSAWLMDNQLFVAATNSGAGLEFLVRSHEQGVRKMALFVTKAPDFGDVRVLVDDKPVGDFSLYSSHVERSRIDLGELNLTPSGSLVSLRVIGKSDLSAGYKMGVDSVAFE